MQSTLQKEKEIFSGNFLKVNILFLIFLSAAILIHIRNNDNARTVFLILIIGIFGIYLNFQYSPENIFGFLFFKDTSFSNPVILLILFPIVIILTGNIYCGYLCPFGAIQEMIGNLCPASLTPDISKPVWKWLKLTKYLIFFAIAFIYIYNGDAIIFKNDPLTTFFSKLYIYKVIYFSFFIFICSFFYKRFWCRNLCPSGAFLSFFNEISLSKYFLKKPVPAKCDLGVQNQDELDCINCDKCKIKN
ncbi:MAG: Spermine synthase family protein [uncultured bacterium]|nr:MAG: Spermine synthase family protein [uncultured bacterium]